MRSSSWRCVVWAVGALTLVQGCDSGGGSGPGTAVADSEGPGEEGGNDSAQSGTDSTISEGPNGDTAGAGEGEFEWDTHSDSESDTRAIGDAGGPPGDTGAGDGGGQPDCEAPEGAPTWNEHIGAIVVSRCGLCHSDPPLYGAPLPLSTYSQLMANSAQVPGATVLERVLARIDDGSMPPPTQAPLQDEELAQLKAWAEGCAPEGPGEFVPPANEGGGLYLPPPPDDAEIFEVRANNHPVPLKVDEYLCFPYTLKLDGPKHIVRFGIEVDQAPVVHHVVLYADTQKLAPNVPFKCGGTPAQSNLVYAWGPGGQDLQFPPGYGFPVQDGDVVLLQVHYNNGQFIDGLLDDSAVTLYVTDPQPNEMGLVATGKMGFSVPPYQELTVTSQCRPKHDITIFASMPHMHEIGKAFDHVVKRADGSEQTIVKVNNWSFADQPFYYTPVKVPKSDRMITTCTYQNPNPWKVNFGSSTSDEMCYNFFYHYPPMGMMFCDELLDEEKVVNYTPGQCAGNQGPSDPPLATGGIKLLEQVSGTYGGVEPTGTWLLQQIDLVLPSFSTPVGNIDQQATKFFAKGFLGAAGDQLTLDVALLGELHLESGLSFPYETQVSLSGTFALNEKGAIVVEATCSTDFQFSQVRFAEGDGVLRALLDAKVPQAGITLTFETLWSAE